MKIIRRHMKRMLALVVSCCTVNVMIVGHAADSAASYMDVIEAARQMQLTSQAQQQVQPQQQTAPVQQAQATQQAQQLSLPPLPPPAAGHVAPTAGANSLNDPAFQNVLKKSFPLTPEQIKALREVFQTMQRASVAPIAVPTPTVSTRIVPLAPGTTPPIIKMATGYVSSIVFLDETGQPWPLESVSVGNPQAFSVTWDKKNNILMIQGIGAYDTGNMAVKLFGMNTPVMLTMVNDQKTVDYRVDLRVQGKGPNAKAAMISGTIPHQASSLLMSLLDGVPPSGSQSLTVDGGSAQAWLRDGNLYLRTTLTVLSPSWTAKMSSADGTQVYEMSPTPMILASDQGRTVQLKIEGL